MRLLNWLLQDPWDLQPGERVIREQRWAEVGGSGEVPDWPEIYVRELARVDSLSDEAILLALEQLVTPASSEWARADPESHRIHVAQVEASKGCSVEYRRALLREVLVARQSFYATLRQETVYRGKVIVLSTASLMAAGMALLGYIYSLVWGKANVGSLMLIEGALLAVLCGWTGGAFTWLIANRRAVATSSLGALREISRWPYTLSRAMIGAFCGLIVYTALGANIITNPIPELFVDQASLEEREAAREAFRALALSINTEAAIRGEERFLRELDEKFAMVRHRNDGQCLRETGVLEAKEP